MPVAIILSAIPEWTEGEGKMGPYYRCYLLDANLKIGAVRGVEGSDDAEAVRKAAQILADEERANASLYHAIEIWHGARRVHVQLAATALNFRTGESAT